ARAAAIAAAAVDELLDAPAADGLADVQVAARVDGHHVQEGELPCHVPGPAEPAEDRLLPEQRRAVVEDPHDLVCRLRLEKKNNVTMAITPGIALTDRAVENQRLIDRYRCHRGERV